ncbi:DUF3549 family protein [Alteromonas sp. 5E99-2]|uniref:DUF3549 family protein n=1 Tax=Alteromonas sp. 5E99-2 TaxID=2817683 RepID=UPI001A9A1EF9|nr:DUF3549 family protein [Alteromonas sp. 5E99-2]MBO1254114.1 DUF3549 family protein [Alteromonas sp. 5E99-2]
MAHNTIDSLSEFLLHAGTEYSVYDLSRGIYQLEPQRFLNIENGIEPCPSPRQGKAWFAVSFSQSKKIQDSEHYLWFICLPIDEESRIIPASRNHFLQTIIDALKADPALTKGLPNNPYVFTPSEVQRGQLVAKLNAVDSNSHLHIDPVLAYVRSPGAIDWQKLVTQDIYYAAACINTNTNITTILIKHWHLLATQFKVTLLQALETEQLNAQLQQFLIDELQKNKVFDDAILYLQALSSQTKVIDLQALLVSILTDNTKLNVNVLTLVASRHYTQFTPAVLRLFLTACIHLDEQGSHQGELFAGFYKDLVAIPALRQETIHFLRVLQQREAQ